MCRVETDIQNISTCHEVRAYLSESEGSVQSLSESLKVDIPAAEASMIGYGNSSVTREQIQVIEAAAQNISDIEQANITIFSGKGVD